MIENPEIERLRMIYYNWRSEAFHVVARTGNMTLFLKLSCCRYIFNVSDEAAAKYHYSHKYFILKSISSIG
jgi:hypothetical protein